MRQLRAPDAFPTLPPHRPGRIPLPLRLQSLLESLGGQGNYDSRSRMFDEVGLRFLEPEDACARAQKLESRGHDDAALRLYTKILDYHPDYTPAMDAAAQVSTFNTFLLTLQNT